MRALMALRHPVYAGSDTVVVSRDVSHDRVVQDVMDAIDLYLHPPETREALAP